MKQAVTQHCFHIWNQTPSMIRSKWLTYKNPWSTLFQWIMRLFSAPGACSAQSMIIMFHVQNLQDIEYIIDGFLSIMNWIFESIIRLSSIHEPKTIRSQLATTNGALMPHMFPGTALKLSQTVVAQWAQWIHWIIDIKILSMNPMPCWILLLQIYCLAKLHYMKVDAHQAK